MSGIEVHDPGDLRKYRTEIPNVVLEMGLTPHALALYIHLKRTAGQNGKCWKSRQRLVEETNMSAGKVSEARAELEAAELISVHRPKHRRKAIEVTITDIWPKNFEHFARRQNMTATSSGYDTRKEPLEESVEANASSGKPQSVGVVSAEKYIVDRIYEAMKEAKLRLPNEHFTYHLGRAQDVLAKDDPTDEEIEALPKAFVDLWTIKGKADAHSALMEYRRQKARPELVNKAAPWEPINPHSPRKSKPMSEENRRIAEENARLEAELLSDIA